MPTTDFFPIIKIEFQYLKETLMHALLDRQGEIQSYVSRELDRLLSQHNFEAGIQMALSEALDAEIKRFFQSSEVRELIRDVLRNTIRLHEAEEK